MASMSEARAWAKSAEAGEYLVLWGDDELDADSDPGSRSGFDDEQLDELGRILCGRDLRLEADDRGLVAVSA